jgi:hypothetical protein
LAPLRIPVLNDEVLALDVAELAETLPESFKRWIRPRGRTPNTKKPTDPVHFRRWLRLDGERHCEENESQRHYKSDGLEPHGDVLL